MQNKFPKYLLVWNTEMYYDLKMWHYYRLIWAWSIKIPYENILSWKFNLFWNEVQLKEITKEEWMKWEGVEEIKKVEIKETSYFINKDYKNWSNKPIKLLLTTKTYAK